MAKVAQADLNLSSKERTLALLAVFVPAALLGGMSFHGLWVGSIVLIALYCLAYLRVAAAHQLAAVRRRRAQQICYHLYASST